VTPLARVLKAQRHLRKASHLLHQAGFAETTLSTSRILHGYANDLTSTARNLDAVAFSLRDIADPTRGGR
jgi:hypothetical protein